MYWKHNAIRKNCWAFSSLAKGLDFFLNLTLTTLLSFPCWNRSVQYNNRNVWSTWIVWLWCRTSTLDSCCYLQGRNMPTKGRQSTMISQCYQWIFAFKVLEDWLLCLPTSADICRRILELFFCFWLYYPFTCIQSVLNWAWVASCAVKIHMSFQGQFSYFVMKIR